MKILLISQHFYPENFRFNDFALALKEKGHEITVITGIPNYPVGDFYKDYEPLKPFVEEWKGIKIYRAPLVPRKNSQLFLVLNYISFPFTATLIALFGLPKKYDAVWVCQSSPIFMAIPANIRRLFRREKTYLWITDLWPESLRATAAVQSNLILKAVEWVVKLVYKNVDHILISCKGFENSIRSKNIRTPISYFPYWAESFYKPIKGVSSFFPEKLVVTFAGNVGAAQGLNVLVDAAAKIQDVKDITFVIIGEGRGMADFKRRIEEKKVADKFEFLGYFPPERMPELFARSDVLFLSLRKDPIFEITVPSKIQSYLACGRPILASIDGEARDVVEESGAGFVVPAENAEELSKSIIKMKSLSKDQREQMGLNGFRYFESNFKREKLLDSIDKLLSGS